MRASGTFDVKVIPQGPPDAADGIALGRMSIDKTFHGGLVGTSQGEMLTGVAEASGAAAYVAIERVTGTLDGRAGAFVLMHQGTMTLDGQHLVIAIAPGSGTGQLAGIAGTLALRVVDQQHFYDLDYSLGVAAAP